MDSRRFDEISRRLAGATTRRSALATLAAMGLGLGGIGLGGRDAGAKKRKKRCKPACTAGQSCVKGACRCDDGGAVCGAACCLIGQECRDGACASLPEPTTCIAYGEPCKNVGAPCCDNLQCGSGQGGAPVACWVRKTGRCTSTAECIYGTECKEGICVGLPPASTCVAEECPVCEAQAGLEITVEPNCIGGACGCACKAAQDVGGFFDFPGTSCRTSTQDCYCVDPQLPIQSVPQQCDSSSAYCCCMTAD